MEFARMLCSCSLNASRKCELWTNCDFWEFLKIKRLTRVSFDSINRISSNGIILRFCDTHRTSMVWSCMVQRKISDEIRVQPLLIHHFFHFAFRSTTISSIARIWTENFPGTFYRESRSQFIISKCGRDSWVKRDKKTTQNDLVKRFEFRAVAVPVSAYEINWWQRRNGCCAVQQQIAIGKCVSISQTVVITDIMKTDNMSDGVCLLVMETFGCFCRVQITHTHTLKLLFVPPTHTLLHTFFLLFFLFPTRLSVPFASE